MSWARLPQKAQSFACCRVKVPRLRRVNKICGGCATWAGDVGDKPGIGVHPVEPLQN